MAIEIGERILANTTKCKDNFKCLSGDRVCLCDVVNSTSFSLIKIKPKSGISCNYFFPLHKSSFCRFPTRNEIY